ncbi:acyltransferase family protein [Telmatocola sphagniphila]
MFRSPPLTFPNIPALDGLRAVAACLVLIHHGSYGRLPGGWIGVDLFFALSGYLITGILAAELSRTGRIRFGRFYIRRVLRLLPALIATVLLAGLLWPITPFKSPTPSWLEAAAAALFYVANLVPAESLGSLSHCWSLAIEEHFYLLWPPILAVAWRHGGLRLAIVLAVSGMAAVAREIALKFQENI